MDLFLKNIPALRVVKSNCLTIPNQNVRSGDSNNNSTDNLMQITAAAYSKGPTEQGKILRSYILIPLEVAIAVKD